MFLPDLMTASLHPAGAKSARNARIANHLSLAGVSTSTVTGMRRRTRAPDVVSVTDPRMSAIVGVTIANRKLR